MKNIVVIVMLMTLLAATAFAGHKEPIPGHPKPET